MWKMENGKCDADVKIITATIECEDDRQLPRGKEPSTKRSNTGYIFVKDWVQYPAFRREDINVNQS